MLSAMHQATMFFFHPKLSHLALLIMPNACNTPIQRYFRFALWHCSRNGRKKRRHLSMHKWRRATAVRRRNGASWSQLTGLLVCTKSASANCPRPVHRRLSIKNCSGNAIWNEPGTSKALVMKARSRDVLLEYSIFELWFIYWAARMPNRQDCSSFCAADTNNPLDLRLLWQAFYTQWINNSQDLKQCCAQFWNLSKCAAGSTR